MTKNNFFNVFLRIVLGCSLLTILSCEKEGVNTISEIPTVPVVSDTDRIIQHFFDLTTYPGYIHPRTGESVLYAPRRWRGDVRIYLDSTVGSEDREIIYNIIDSVSTYIEGSGVNFSYTDDIDNFEVGIVNGPPEYMNSIFGTNVRNSDESYETYGAVSGYANCVTLVKKFMWSENSIETIIGHELGHVLGLSHAEQGKSMMYPLLGQMDPFFTKQDIAVLKLLYYNGIYGENFPISSDIELCNELYLTETQEEDLREKLRLIIENDFK
jgi:hypothetical protein